MEEEGRERNEAHYNSEVQGQDGHPDGLQRLSGMVNHQPVGQRRLYGYRHERGGVNVVCGKVEVIINAMVASCMSPQEIADKAGVSVSIVYRVRKGYMVKMERFGKVCRALGLQPEDAIDHERLKAFKERGKS